MELFVLFLFFFSRFSMTSIKSIFKGLTDHFSSSCQSAILKKTAPAFRVNILVVICYYAPWRQID